MYIICIGHLINNCAQSAELCAIDRIADLRSFMEGGIEKLTVRSQDIVNPNAEYNFFDKT